MFVPEEMDSPKKQHKLALSDQAWAGAQQRAAIEGFSSTSDLCEYLLHHYLSLAEEGQELVKYTIPEEVERKYRSVYLSTLIWAGLKARKVIEGRPVSEILEQTIRAYLGLPLTFQ